MFPHISWLSIYFYNYYDLCIGCPTKHDNSKTTWKSSFILEFICDIYSSTYFNMHDSWNNNQKILLVLAFPKCGLPFLCCHIIGDMQDIRSDFNFVK